MKQRPGTHEAFALSTQSNCLAASPPASLPFVSGLLPASGSLSPRECAREKCAAEATCLPACLLPYSVGLPCRCIDLHCPCAATCSYLELPVSTTHSIGEALARLSAPRGCARAVQGNTNDDCPAVGAHYPTASSCNPAPIQRVHP